MDALNGIDVKCAAIQNEDLNASPKERVWLRSGKEFGVQRGRVLVIISALYDLKGDGSEWESALMQLMRELGFIWCRVYRDVLIRVAVDTLELGETENERLPTGKRFY